MEDSIRDPAAAVDSMISQQPGLKPSREELLAQMKTYGNFIRSKATAGKPTLWMAAEDVASTLEVAKQVAKTDFNLQVSNVFTNEFLPSQ
jgi:hypothetical protein